MKKGTPKAGMPFFMIDSDIKIKQALIKLP